MSSNGNSMALIAQARRPIFSFSPASGERVGVSVFGTFESLLTLPSPPAKPGGVGLSNALDHNEILFMEVSSRQSIARKQKARSPDRVGLMKSAEPFCRRRSRIPPAE